MNPPVPYGYRLLGDDEVMPEGTLRIDGCDRVGGHAPKWWTGNASGVGKTVKEFKKNFPSLQIECVCAPVEVPEGYRLVGADEVLPREYKWNDPAEWSHSWISSPQGCEGVYAGETPTRARQEHPARTFSVPVEVEKAQQDDLEKWLYQQISYFYTALANANESQDLTNAMALQCMLVIYSWALCTVQCDADIEAAVRYAIENTKDLRHEALENEQLAVAFTLGYDEMALYEILRKITT